MRDDVGIGALELGDQRGEIGRRGGIAFAQHDLQAGFLRVLLVGGGDADTIGPVFVDQRDLPRLGIHTELGLGVLDDEAGEGLAILIGVDLPAEHVSQVLVLEDGGGYRGGDPEDLLLRLDLGGERHRVRAGIDAVDDLDVFLIDKALDLVDRSVRLALRVGVNPNNFIFAGNTAAFVTQIDGYLSTDGGCD